MNMNLNKMWAIAAVAVASFFSVNAGEVRNGNFGMDSGPSCAPCDPCAPVCSNECGTFVAEFAWLYWQANETGLEYGYESHLVPGTVVSPIVTADLFTRRKQLRFDFDSGFRVGVGFRPADSNWEFDFVYTTFSTRAHGHTDLDGLAYTFVPVFLPFSLFPPTDAVVDLTGDIDARWRLGLHLLDFDLSREFLCCNCVYLRPHFGVRVARIKQSYHIETATETTISLTTAVPDYLFQDIKMTNNFTGTGVRGGFGAEWCFGDFGIWGDTALSLAYGSFDIHQYAIENYSAAGIVAASATLEQKFKTRVTRAISDISIGVDYRSLFWCDRITVILSAAYEQHYFWGQNLFQKFDIPVAGLTAVTPVEPDARRGSEFDLGTQGLTLSLGFEF